MLIPELMAMARDLENTHYLGQNRGPPLDQANYTNRERAGGEVGARKKTGIWFLGKGGMNAEQAETSFQV